MFEIVPRVVACLGLSLVAFGCARGPATATRSADPIRVEVVERSLADGGVARGFIARIDLADPRLRVAVTGPLESPPPRTEARLETTPSWAISHDLDLAVNANYFAVGAGRGYVVGATADMLGLCVSDGRLVSPPRSFEGRGDPVLMVMEGGHAVVACPLSPPDAAVRHAVAGIGGSPSDPKNGTPLIEGGKDRSATARVDPTLRHPRTAAGLTADGRTLLLVAIDGRQPGWSDGMTLPELAALMLQHGAVDAINLDGGGSTSFVWRDGSGAWRTNRASERSGFRPVSTSIGVRVLR
ncbi:MAG: phosphodiester glycosidase family protein [Phycisphaerae bacterium]|jgi:hypothetical protein